MKVRTAMLAALLAIGASAAATTRTILRFSVWDGDEALATVRQLCRDYEKENPHVKIKLENYPDYNVYHQKIFITYAAGAAPDVVMMDPGRFQRLAVRGALLNLNPFFEKTPGFDIKEYYKPLVDAHSYKGNCYVLPRDVAPVGLIYYNKRMFDEAGIPYPDGSWTWDFKIRPELKEKDFLWVCQQFVKKDAKGKYVRWGYAPGWPMMVAEQTSYQTGAYAFDDFEEMTKVQVASPGYIRAVQFAADLSNKLHLAPTNTESASQLQLTTQQLFIQQKIAMYQNGIWEVPRMRRSLKPGSKEFFEWDIALAPAYWNNGKPVRKYTTGGSGYGIMASCKNPDEAWKFVRYMAGPPGMIAMARAGIAQPGIRKLALEPGIWIPGPNTPLEEQYPRNRIATDQAVEFIQFAPTSQYFRSVQERTDRSLELVWNNQKTAEQVLRENQVLAQNRLDVLRRNDSLPRFNWAAGGIIALALTAWLVFWIFGKEAKVRVGAIARRESISGLKFVSPWLIGFVLFTLIPMLISLLMAFSEWDIIQPAKFRGLGNFNEAFTEDPAFWKSLSVTAIYTVFSVPLGILGSLGLALLLNQKVRGVQLFRTLYYIPSICSAVAGALIWQRLLNPESGLLNAILYGADGKWPVGRWLSQVFLDDPSKQIDWLQNPSTALPALIIMSLWGIGGGTVVFLAGLQGIPGYLYEAATLDGASIWQRFRAVTWPLLSPTLFFTLLTGCISAFQAFHQAYIMTGGGPADATRFYVYHLYQNAFESGRMGYASALAWILFFITLGVALLQWRLNKKVYYEAEAR